MQVGAQVPLAELAMDSLQEGISIADFRQPDAPLIYVNSGFSRMTGYSKAETVGHNCRFLQGNGTDSSAVDKLRAAIRSGSPVEVELMNYRKDGTAFLNHLSLTPIIDPADGTVTHYVGIQSDVTQLHAAREAEISALRQAAQAEAATAAKSRFLAHMSHEIRTPLNGILAVGQMLSETQLTDEQRDLVNTIRLSGETLLSLICDILDFSRIEAQKLLLDERPFDLEDALERALQICSMTAAKKRINVTCTVDPNVPRILLGDMGRLQQVLLNSLGNSLKFTSDGGSVELHCCALRAPDGGVPLLEMRVQDNGIGISPEGLSKLFASFSQVDSSPSRKYDGAGLGLAISRRLCEAMGGSMRAESDGLGLGATFYMTIALKEPQPDQHDQAAGSLIPLCQMEREACASMLNGKRVLVCDECKTVRAAIASWLADWGAPAVRCCSSDMELRECLARDGPWDAVILESKTTLLQAVSTHMDQRNGQPTRNEGSADNAASGQDSAGQSQHMQVFALTWPAAQQLSEPTVIIRAPVSSASGDRSRLALGDPAESAPQSIVPSCINIPKPVRHSRLREALASVYVPHFLVIEMNAAVGMHMDEGTIDGRAKAQSVRSTLQPSASTVSLGDLAREGNAGHAAAPAGTITVGNVGGAANIGPRRLRIMLAEDHIINQKVVIGLLNKYGHQVTCVACDGVDALEKLRALPHGPNSFDVILMDLHMPRMGGIDCAAAITAEWPHCSTPVIAVTADAFEESRQRCLDAGFAGWLAKPFRVDGMVKVLSDVCGLGGDGGKE